MKKVISLFFVVAMSLQVMAEEIVLPSNVRTLLPEGTTAVVTYLDENVINRGLEEMPMVKCNRMLFFAAKNAETGTELWVSDGTPEGTNMIKDINPGTGSSSPKWMTACGKKVFFCAETDEAGAELWVTDGTEAGTHIVMDIYEGTVGSAPIAITALDDKRVLFFAMDEESEWTPVISGSTDEKWLWVSDGTTEGTMRIGQTPSKYDMAGTFGCIVVVNGKGVFPGYDAVNNQTLWATDGTAEGTKALLNINPRVIEGGAFATEAANIEHLVPVDGRIAAFRATTVKEVVGGDMDWGMEMWITDGTTEGTKQIGFPINKLEKDGAYASCDFRQTYPIGNHLYFRANNGNKAVNGAEPYVWYIDKPIEEGVNPRMIQDCAHINDVMYYNSHPSCFYEYKDYMYCALNFTYKVSEVDPETGAPVIKTWDSKYHNLARGKISEIEAGPDYFPGYPAEGPIQGEYLWTGFEIFPGSQAFIHKFATANDTCFFVCRDADQNYELWKLDSKVAGSAQFDKPVKVLDLPGDGQICYNTVLHQNLYFISATTGQLYQYMFEKLIVDDDDADPTEAVETVDATTHAMKYIENGQVIIRRGDRTYNILGAEL